MGLVPSFGVVPSSGDVFLPHDPLPSPLMRPGDGSGGMFQPGWPCLLSLFLNRNWSKLVGGFSDVGVHGADWVVGGLVVVA